MTARRKLRRYWLVARHLREAECLGLCPCGCGDNLFVIHEERFTVRQRTYDMVKEAING